ncbi:hypothetical protein MUK42_34721, partial [Musa troglodytarum]
LYSSLRLSSPYPSEEDEIQCETSTANATSDHFATFRSDSEVSCIAPIGTHLDLFSPGSQIVTGDPWRRRQADASPPGGLKTSTGPSGASWPQPALDAPALPVPVANLSNLRESLWGRLFSVWAFGFEVDHLVVGFEGSGILDRGGVELPLN